jgi:hypothetical protein
MHRSETVLERALSDPIPRRQLLAGADGLAAAAGLSRLPGHLAWAVDSRADGDPFTLGVACGDPRPYRANIWTRLAPRPLRPDGGMRSWSSAALFAGPLFLEPWARAAVGRLPEPSTVWIVEVGLGLVVSVYFAWRLVERRRASRTIA